MNNSDDTQSGIMLITVNSDDFVKWLNDRLLESGISQAELARRGNISRASISKALDPATPPGWDVCYGIAQGLKIPPLLVFRKAGLLPSKRGSDELKEEYLIQWDELENNDQEETLEFMRMKYRRAQLKAEATDIESILQSIPPDAMDEVARLFDDFAKKHGYRRVK